MNSCNITILDGGMGRELERRGAPFQQPEWSALAMIEAPNIVKEVHKDFIRSGARVITTNSYALVPFHIGETRFAEQGKTLAQSAAREARAAVQESGENVLVAGSIPPLFGSYRADLYQADKVIDIATPLVEALSADIDLWLCETQSLIAEASSIKTIIDQHNPQNKPVWLSFTLEDSEQTETPLLRSGETVAEAVTTMARAGVSAILFNCSQPETIADAIVVARKTLDDLELTDIQIGAYANAFPPQPKDATANDGLDELRADLTPQSYLEWAKQWQSQGASLIGGCCGIGPEHIAQLSTHLTSA